MTSKSTGNGYCRTCGTPVENLIPVGDNRPRDVCPSCGHIHYENPKVIVGCLLEWESKVLLCKRAIEPRYGYWTLPAGFMENKETTQVGAAREAFEEARAECDNLRLFAVYNLPRISQVYVMYFGQLRNGFARASEETLETRLVEEQDVPWDALAFPVVTESLKRYFELRHQEHWPVLSADIVNRAGQPLDIIRHP